MNFVDTTTDTHNAQPNLSISHGKVVTTSMAVAAFFEKQHYHTVRDIETLIEQAAGDASNFGGISNDTPIAQAQGGRPNFGPISDETPIQDLPNFGGTSNETLNEEAPGDALNFEGISYIDSRNRTRRGYQMDRDAFSILAMGFTFSRPRESTREKTHEPR